MLRACRIAAVMAVLVLAILWWCSGRRTHDARATEHDRSHSAGDVARAAHANARDNTPELAALVPGELRLEGLATDEDDHPLAGAKITLDGARTATTELDGSFAFDGVAAGTHDVTAERELAYGEAHVELDATSDPVMLQLEVGPTIVMKVVSPDGAPIAGASLECTGHAATTGADGIARLRGVSLDSEIVYVSAAGRETVHETVNTGDDPGATVEHVVMLGAGFALDGRVVDETGQPVVDVQVEVEAKTGRRDESTRSDDHGEWHFTALGAGAYKVHASSERHVASDDVTCEVHGHTELVMHVDSGARITGHVVDEAGRPVEGARVSAGPRDALTDATGAFALLGLPPDSYEVGAATQTGFSTTRKLVLARGGHAEVDLVMRPSTIAGIVVDASGHPVEDARVIGHGPEPFGFVVARSDARGHFDLGGVPPGDYELEVRRHEARLRVDPVPVRVASGTRDVRLVSPDVATIVGRVVRAGQPVPYFGIAMANDLASLHDGWPKPVRAASGAFRLQGVEPGTWHLALVGPGFARRIVEGVRVEPGATVDLGDIVVAPGEVVHGRVADAQGAAVGGATIRLGAASDRVGRALLDRLAGSYSAVSDDRGEFEIDGVAREDLAGPVVANHPDFRDLFVSVDRP